MLLERKPLRQRVRGANAGTFVARRGAPAGVWHRTGAMC
jgi:hypothetical protein